MRVYNTQRQPQTLCLGWVDTITSVSGIILFALVCGTTLRQRGLHSLLSSTVWMQLFKIGGNSSNLGGPDC